MAIRFDLQQGTPEWLAWRVNKWSTPLMVYKNKLNPQPHTPSKYEEWGTLLEDVIKFKKFAKEHPEFEVRQGACYSDDWRKCSLDGELWRDGKPVAILEIKTGRSMKGWDPVPSYYMAQVQWQMHVTGIHKAYFGVLLNGCDYFEREVDYDPHYCEELEAACLKLWQCICNKTPPDPIDLDIELAMRAQPDIFEAARQKAAAKPV